MLDSTPVTYPAYTEIKLCKHCGQVMKWYRNGKQRNGDACCKWKCNSCDNKRKKERNPDWASERKARQQQRNPDYRSVEYTRRVERRNPNGSQQTRKRRNRREANTRRKHSIDMQEAQN